MEHTVAIATLVFLLIQSTAILYGLWRMIQTTREAKAARAQAIQAALRAEAAAVLAVEHARTNATAMTTLVGDMRELATNTNSIQDALNKVNRELGEAAGEKRGIAMGVAQSVVPKE